MKVATRESTMSGPSGPDEAPDGLPAAAVLSALRAWYEGLGARKAVVRYLPNKKSTNP